MFGKQIPASHPAGMRVFIDDVPAGSLSADTWDRLNKKVKRSKVLMLKQIHVLSDELFDITVGCIGRALAGFGAIAVCALMFAPEVFDATVAEGFATKAPFMLAIVFLASLVISVCYLIFSKKTRRDPVEEELWRLVRLELSLPATSTYRVAPETTRIDVPSTESEASR